MHRPGETTLATALGATAAVLSLVVIALALRLAPARAEMVSHVGEYAVLTTDGGNEEVLLVLDQRAEELYVYRVENQSVVELLARESLPELFAAARLGLGPRR